jgi:hypothetical protein
MEAELLANINTDGVWLRNFGPATTRLVQERLQGTLRREDAKMVRELQARSAVPLNQDPLSN